MEILLIIAAIVTLLIIGASSFGKKTPETNYDYSEQDFLPEEDEDSPDDNERHPITKSEAINKCLTNGLALDNPKRVTFATKNKSANSYWANPAFSLLSYEWWLLLNDKINNELHVFMIPANSIPESQMLARADKTHLIDMQIIYDDKSFTDSRSGIEFLDWFIMTIPY